MKNEMLCHKLLHTPTCEGDIWMQWLCGRAINTKRTSDLGLSCSAPSEAHAPVLSWPNFGSLEEALHWPYQNIQTHQWGSCQLLDFN